MRLTRHTGRPAGQALTEFALVFPMFILVLFSIIVLGLFVFYNQQLQNAAREAARYAIVHSSTAQCPTVSRINPIGPNKPDSYDRCDAPEGGWPRMTAAARSRIWGVAPTQVFVSACWSGFVDPSGNADALPTTPGVTYTDCTIGRTNPQTNAEAISCPPPATVPSASGVDGGKADGDDKASALAYANSVHYPTRISVFACFNWTPPMSGFVFIPNQITLRAVVTEALQRQQ